MRSRAISTMFAAILVLASGCSMIPDNPDQQIDMARQYSPMLQAAATLTTSVALERAPASDATGPSVSCLSGFSNSPDHWSLPCGETLTSFP